MSFASTHPNLDYLVGELVEGIIGAKRAVVDGKFEPSEVREVLSAVDPALGEYVARLLVALKGIYPEVGDLVKAGPFAMMMEVAPYMASKLMGIFK